MEAKLLIREKKYGVRIPHNSKIAKYLLDWYIEYNARRQPWAFWQMESGLYINNGGEELFFDVLLFNDPLQERKTDLAKLISCINLQFKLSE